ncbi:MAG: GNAT family N-acetyltransferase [Desulfovibrio sp.]|uniref:GNAT family N-acetyltransferase n=1 Tax=Desulfovibrio sp. 7SRBS1 TaxID=3378064 RepID=UPI003B3EC522
MTVIPQDALTIQWLENIDQVRADEWNALAVDATPFMSWEWLELLEASGSVGPGTGWHPFHLTVRRGDRLVGAAPLYLKGHSMGEFVFDQVWAEAAARVGISYYPKLVGMSPFSPVTGYRFLTAADDRGGEKPSDPHGAHSGAPNDVGPDVVAQPQVQPLVQPSGEGGSILSSMHRCVDALVRGANLGGASFLFVDPQFGEDAARRGYHLWEHQAFLWENQGYADFDDYLGRFNSNRRRTIRKERRELHDQGVRVRFVPHQEFTSELLDLMQLLYSRTNDKFGIYSCKFLTPEFFRDLSGAAGAEVLLGVAEVPGEKEPVAMALFVRRGDRLWGRYWGTRLDIRFLHFELCMYAPVEWAIAQGIRQYDPGMGGNHKAVRGFVSRPGLSAHRFAEPAMNDLFKRNIGHINELERAYMDELNALVPLHR